MKKSLRIGLVGLVVLLGVSTPIDAAPPKKKTFWQKHKGKVIAGVAAAALLGITVALGIHANKTKKVVEEAGFTGSEFAPPTYEDAMAIVGIFGPIPRAHAISILKKISDIDERHKRETKILLTGKVGTALAKYWGISQNQLEQEMGYPALGRGFRVVERLGEDAANRIAAAAKGMFATGSK